MTNHTRSNTSADNADDASYPRTLPWGDRLHRKAIAFVPASDATQPIEPTSCADVPSSSSRAADLYLDIVLPRKRRENASTSPEGEGEVIAPVAPQPQPQPTPTFPTDPTPEQRTASQTTTPQTLNLAPWALDGTRMGLRYMESRGWDPDARVGLGAARQGIPVAVKAKPKEDRLGIGMDPPPPGQKKKKENVKLLGAGKVRKMVEEERKRAERLRREIHGKLDLEKYLGPGAVQED